MRPTPSTTYTSSPNATFWRLNSPLPYLFGGLALMLILITAALILLACSFRKRSLLDTEVSGEKSVKPCQTAAAVDCSPRIVVILAGADNPTHLALPVPCSLSKTDGV